MTQPYNNHPEGAPGDEEHPRRGPVIRDKRRIDPKTGRARSPEGTTPPPADAGPARPSPDGDPAAATEDSPPGGADQNHPDTALAAERLEEMRRMQAEFVNFRNRTQREREGDRTRATGVVVEALLPVMDDIHMAREHGELTDGPFAAIADKLEQALARFGVERVGTVGDVFDPTVHEALMHLPADTPGVSLPEGAKELTVIQVMQPGFKIGDQVVRAARVAVADPS